MKKDNIIQIRSFEFALRIIELYKLMTSQKEYVISNYQFITQNSKFKIQHSPK